MKKTIETASGFKCKLDDTILDDMRLMDLIADLDENQLLYPKFVSFLLGDELKEKLYQHIAEKGGRVPIAALDAELQEIMEQLGGGGDTVKK